MASSRSATAGLVGALVPFAFAALAVWKPQILVALLLGIAGVVQKVLEPAIMSLGH